MRERGRVSVMVLAVHVAGYNILFGYAGLLSLGLAMFFATGLHSMFRSGGIA